MGMTSAVRLRVAGAIVGILSLAAAFRSAEIAKVLARDSPDPYRIESALARFAPLAARLPRGAVVGYLSDLPPGDRATLAFLQAQYALAPCLLVAVASNDPPELAVGNFIEAQNPAQLAAAQGYVVEADFGRGLFLLRRRASR